MGNPRSLQVSKGGYGREKERDGFEFGIEK